MFTYSKIIDKITSAELAEIMRRIDKAIAITAKIKGEPS